MSTLSTVWHIDSKIADNVFLESESTSHAVLSLMLRFEIFEITVNTFKYNKEKVKHLMNMCYVI